MWIINAMLIAICIVGAKQTSMVLFSSNKEIKSFTVPVSRDPILSWLDVQEGIYPNVTPITSEIQIGTPLSIMIYYTDRSKLYDMVVDNCLAYEERTLDESNNVFVLYNYTDTKEETYGKINHWKKVINNREHTTLLHSNFTAFKFPDKDKIFLTCNVELCYGNCNLKKQTLNEI